MNYIKDLGRVKGDKGIGFKPKKVNETATTVTIEWEATENDYTGPIPENIIIQKSLILPLIEGTTLSWYQANNNPEALELFEDIILPSSVNLKGDKGDTGDTKIDVLVYETLDDIAIDNRSTLYYIGNDNNGYEVYVYDPTYTNKYRKVGLSSIDLSNYYTKSETQTILEEYATIEYVDGQIAQAIDLIDNSIIPKLG